MDWNLWDKANFKGDLMKFCEIFLQKAHWSSPKIVKSLYLFYCNSATAWQNQHSDLWWRIRSAWASVQSDQSSLCSLWGSQRPYALSCKQPRPWPDCADAQTLQMHRLTFVLHLFVGFAQPRFQLSHVTRKPVFGVCDQVRLKLTCSASETSFEISDLAS